MKFWKGLLKLLRKLEITDEILIFPNINLDEHLQKWDILREYWKISIIFGFPAKTPPPRKQRIFLINVLWGSVAQHLKAEENFEK